MPSAPRPEQPDHTIGSIVRTALWNGRRGFWLSASTAGFVLHQAGEAAVPVLIGVVIDQAIVRSDPIALVIWLAALAGVFVVLSVSYQRASLGMVRVFGRGEHEVRQLTLARVLHPRGRSARHGTGEVLSITTSDADRVAGVSWSIAEQAATLTALLFASVSLLLISAPLGIGVLLGAVLVLVGMHALARPLERLGMAEQSSVAGASEVATDTMAGLRVVRGLSAEDEAVRRYRVASAASLAGAIATARRSLDYEAMSRAISVLYLGALAFVAAWMALQGDITVGQLITVVALAQFLQGALAHIGTFGANWAHKRASARRVHALVAAPYALPSGSASVESTGRAALVWNGPSRRIESAEGMLVGVRVADAAQARRASDVLALRVAPSRGEIILHGEDAHDLDPVRYRESVLAPPHDAALFTGTLRDNVTGLASPHHARVDWDEAIISAVALDDVVAHLGSPDAPLGERGMRLSGGQRQRVLLARALHHAAELVVLDEPTTALDPVTEQRVAEGLRRLRRTMIIITSSRLLLNACDRVIDLDEELTELAR